MSTDGPAPRIRGRTSTGSGTRASARADGRAGYRAAAALRPGSATSSSAVACMATRCSARTRPGSAPVTTSSPDRAEAPHPRDQPGHRGLPAGLQAAISGCAGAAARSGPSTTRTSAGRPLSAPPPSRSRLPPLPVPLYRRSCCTAGGDRAEPRHRAALPGRPPRPCRVPGRRAAAHPARAEVIPSRISVWPRISMSTTSGWPMSRRHSTLPHDQVRDARMRHACARCVRARRAGSARQAPGVRDCRGHREMSCHDAGGLPP